MENQGWLKVVINQMQKDLADLRKDMKILLEERAIAKGRMYVISGLIAGTVGFGTELVAMWLRAK